MVQPWWARSRWKYIVSSLIIAFVAEKCVMFLLSWAALGYAGTALTATAACWWRQGRRQTIWDCLVRIVGGSQGLLMDTFDKIKSKDIVSFFSYFCLYTLSENINCCVFCSWKTLMETTYILKWSNISLYEIVSTDCKNWSKWNPWPLLKALFLFLSFSFPSNPLPPPKLCYICANREGDFQKLS